MLFSEWLLARGTPIHRQAVLTVRCNIKEIENQYSAFPLRGIPLQISVTEPPQALRSKRISIRKMMGTDQQWAKKKKAQ